MGALHPAPTRTVAVVGAGPRGLTVLERLVAHADDSGRACRIHLVDPCPPGAGLVWRTDQAPSLLMNTTIAEQTVFPDETCDLVPGIPGEDMATWCARVRPELLAETGPDAVFASRALYGEYLRWAHERILEQAPDHVEIVHHADSVVGIVEPTGHPGLDAKQIVRLASGASLEVDEVVLCLGHLPAQLTDERRDWARFARNSGGVYLPPGLPAEAPVDSLPAGQTALVRGFGLNYFDIQTLVTVGRGGRFEPAGEGLSFRYVPSGAEPVLAPSSRRGVPYRAKPITPAHPRGDYVLRYFTRENIARLASAGEPLRFNDQLWPLVLADIRQAWYAVLATHEPEAFRGDPARLTEAIGESVDRHISRRAEAETRGDDGRPGRVTQEAPAFAAVLDEVVADPARILDLHALLRPLEGLHFPERGAGTPEAPGLQAWMIDFLERDVAAACAGPEASPEKSVFSVLWSARSLLKDVVAEDLLDPVSFVTEVRGWFEDFVSGICDGPPPERIAQLVALARAGLVTIVGPEVRITTGRDEAESRFSASSPAVDGPVLARALVDAASPANNVRIADDVLLRGMLDRHQVTPAAVTMPSGIEQRLSGLETAGDSFRAVDARGRVNPHLHVFSIQLSARRLGLAIASNPRTGARNLTDADRIARDVLDLGATPGPTTVG